MAKPKSRNTLTATTLKTAANMLYANEPYAKIAKQLSISPATIGRLKGVIDGKIDKNNQRIADLLASSKEKPQEMDTHCEQPHTLSGLLDELEADLTKLNQRCEQIRKIL